MDIRSQHPTVLQTLNLILDMTQAAGPPGFGDRVRKEEVAGILGLERKASDEVLRYMQKQGWVRFVLFGCVQLTTKGREAAFSARHSLQNWAQ